MQVLSCYQPPSDPVTFSPKQEPLVIFSAGHTLCVATTQRNVEVYEVDGEQCRLIQTFSTAGLVMQGVFNSTGDYIAVLEVRERNQAANVRIYSNWQNSLSTDSPVKARIAGQAPSTSSWDLLHPHPFELIELPLRTSPKCLNCCLLTGNVVVGLSNSLALFKCVIQNKGTDTEYKDFTHLLDIIVTIPVKDVALTQQYVAFASSHQLHCFKLTFGDWTQDQIGVKSAALETSSLAEVDMDQKLLSLGGDDQASASPGSSDETTGDKIPDGKESEATSGKDSEVISGQDSEVTWNFGSARYTIPETFMRPIRKPNASSITLSSVKYEKLFHDDSKVPVEILGPKEKVKGHPVQVKWDEVYLYSEGGLAGSQLQVSITHLLYRKFSQAKDSTSGDIVGPIHSLQLLPNFKKDQDNRVLKDDVDPLGTSQKTLQSLCCFISTTTDGFLYNVLETPCLLSQYSYKADALSVKAGHSLLYALTQNGLEIYTLRSFAAAFQRLDAKDENILASPPVDLDVCMIGLLPWINITHLSVSVNHVTLLSKTKQPTSPSYRNAASKPLRSWDIQVLHKAALEEVFNEMLALGQRYQNSSKEAYLQLLQEGHIILKGALLLSIDATQDFTSLLDRNHFNSTMSSLQQLFLKTCALLAQYYSRPDVEDGHLAVPYYKMSQLSLQQILRMFTLEDDDATSTAPTPTNLGADDVDEGSVPALVPPGPGLISYLDGLMFGDEKPLDLDVDEKLCNRILDIYGKVAPSKLSQLILLSTLNDSLSPDKAMESLQKLNSLAGYKPSTTDVLTSVWLYIQLGDLEQANSLLGMLNIDEISQLLADHSQLLYGQDNCELTFFAQLIRQQEPESLFEALLQLLDEQKLSLSTCTKLLQTNDDKPTHMNTHHRQFLELVLAQKHRHEVSKEATAQLVSIYIERLKLWKPSALPPQRSSRRHRHVPRGTGCYATRLTWLNSLPPFTGTSPLSQRCLRTTVSAATPRLQSASVLGLLQVSSQNTDEEIVCPCCCCNEDLIKLQSLLSSECCDASVVNQVLQAVRESQFRGSTSLNILCLNRLNPSVALGLLVNNHMAIVLDYAMTTFNGDAGSWTRLLQLVLMVAKETWTDGKKEEHPVVLETLKGILEFTSTHLEPQDFIHSLPNDGILSFFTPYLEQSCRRHKVKVLQTQALTMVTTEDASS